MSKARGIRESVEVLVRSDIQNSALVDVNRPVGVEKLKISEIRKIWGIENV